ncbi:MAG: aldo/keto reductase [Oscillospiraceae bacterium]|nr:aldo/keto reductase [Oscillospiraceae bacterium]
MNYRVLGRTGIRVSEIGLGGEGFEGKSYEECEAILDCAMQNGVNFIDIYNSNPQMRSNVGKALSRYPRESFVLEGHLGSFWEDGQYRRTRRPDEVKAAYEDLFARLGVDYVDIGMLHFIDDDRDFDTVFGGEMLAYAQELKASGKVRCLGLSTHNTDIALRAAGTGLIDVILFSVNPAYDMLPPNDNIDLFFERSTYEGRVYEGIDPKRAQLYGTCQNAGVALTVMKGYAAGVLLDARRSPFGQALTPVQCLHYCLTRPAVASVMVGAFCPEEVLAATAYSSAPEEERDYSAVLAGAPRRAFHGHCMYCGHCAPCPKKIDVAMVNKYLDLSLAQGAVPETLRDHYALLPHKAGECVSCGRCMKNCPFGVDVISKMKQAAELFGA